MMILESGLLFGRPCTLNHYSRAAYSYTRSRFRCHIQKCQVGCV